jgi:preprotein translocase subunit YajC
MCGHSAVFAGPGRAVEGISAMLHTMILFAQDAPAPAPGAGANPLGPLLPLIIIMALFFFLIVLPGQKRERKQREELLTRLKKNDEVITTSGIIGIVTSIKEPGDEVTIKSEDTRLRVLKSSIARIVTKSGEDGIQDMNKRSPS